jgi:hypothetical protein
VPRDHASACCIYGNNFCEFRAVEMVVGSGTKPVQITGVRRAGRGPGFGCFVFGGIISRLYTFTHADQAEVILQLRVSLSEYKDLQLVCPCLGGERGHRKNFYRGPKTLSATSCEWKIESIHIIQLRYDRHILEHFWFPASMNFSLG